MNTYEVTITATITKTLVVTADDSEAAIEEAHETFNPNADGNAEHYEQETLSWRKVNDL